MIQEVTQRLHQAREMEGSVVIANGYWICLEWNDENVSTLSIFTIL